ncbi:pyridoxal phosphate-dependent decarboxylase family protein [Cryptosporangium phraense]|uniref:Aminotransferase class I/II-fold pyridoxal phosphate-dependent enzyme n=1 Tax=Cryptosporangium phraense TaxID=2593070 RepID=A0A545AP98_9ACTN|nr:aminotransferase class I/II-fold pyridoxal phosphate-dependent enzyme [Cryptosporangium phraense]TQS43126.1 aminotransferase class I/II-fold pyridoxal phosphate-dependent enzyme [Cryptosporangium phraense]
MPSNASESAALAGRDSAVLAELLRVALDALAAGARDRGGPAPAGTPAVLDAAWRNALGGAPGAEALRELVRVFAAGSVDPADPWCAAHLHTPPLALAVAADLAASALNPSLDSWDQAPIATTLEPAVIAELAALAGFDPATASGVVTTGGSESNLLGLLLARERAIPGAVRTGLPAGRYRIYGSAVTHFSVHRAAGLLGFGEDAVVPVDTGRDHRLDPDALDRALTATTDHPIAIVATAGTTDLGAIDDLPAIAEVAAKHRVWLHVDAAYGGGALFSERLAPLLSGLERADSVGLDLHKLGWQPVAAGIFLTCSATNLTALARRAEYLNPADDEDAGYTSLLGRSLRTTRRPDALKIAVTLRALGRDGLGRLVDRCSALAHHAAAAVEAEPALELYQPPVLTTVVFRYRASDEVNARLRRALLAAGRAVVGRTEIDGRVWLKLTLLNPDATEADVDGLLAAVLDAGAAELKAVR